MVAVMRIQVAGLPDVSDGESRNDGALGAAVTITSVGTGTTHSFRIWNTTDPTPPTVVVLSGTQWRITPVTGAGHSYILELTIDDGLPTEDIQRRVYRIPSANLGLLMPAPNERAHSDANRFPADAAEEAFWIEESYDNVDNNYYGWTARANAWLRQVDLFARGYDGLPTGDTAAWRLRQGANNYINLDTANAIAIIGSANVATQVDLPSAALNGFRVSLSGQNLFNVNTTSNTLELGSASFNPSFHWLGTGPWSVGGGFGTAGQALISNGAGAAPSWQAAGVTDHGALTGLTPDDDHTQYALLAGRASGQVLAGGTAASELLTLRSTTNAARGAITFEALTTADADVTIRLHGGDATNQTRLQASYDSSADQLDLDFFQDTGGNGTFIPPAISTLGIGRNLNDTTNIRSSQILLYSANNAGLLRSARWAITSSGTVEFSGTNHGGFSFVGALDVTTGGQFLTPTGTASPGHSFTGDTDTGLAQNGADILGLVTSGVVRQQVESFRILFTPGARGSGFDASFDYTAPAHVNQTAGTEVLMHRYRASTVQHASNTAVPIQRWALYEQPTYSFATAGGVITDSATLAIAGPPIAGTNATITNPFALWTQSGTVQFGSAQTADTDQAVHLAGGDGTNQTRLQLLYDSNLDQLTFQTQQDAAGNGAFADNFGTYIFGGQIQLSRASGGATSIRQTASDSGVTIQGNKNAASSTPDIIVRSSAVRSAGNLLQIDRVTTTMAAIDFSGAYSQAGLPLTINSDAAAATAENPYIYLLGGDGVTAPNDDILRTQILQDSVNETLRISMERNRNGAGYAVVAPSVDLGIRDATANLPVRLRFNDGTGAAVRYSYLIFDGLAGTLSLQVYDGSTESRAMRLSVANSGIQFGQSTSTPSTEAIQIGWSANGSATRAIALGRSAACTASDSIAIGGLTNVAHGSSFAIGRGAVTTATNQGLLGGTTSYLTDLVLGAGDTDATARTLTMRATSGTGATSGWGLTISSGVGGATNAAGGDLTLTAGAGGGSGADGGIFFRTNATERYQIEGATGTLRGGTAGTDLTSIVQGSNGYVYVERQGTQTTPTLWLRGGASHDCFIRFEEGGITNHFYAGIDTSRTLNDVVFGYGATPGAADRLILGNNGNASAGGDSDLLAGDANGTNQIGGNLNLWAGRGTGDANGGAVTMNLTPPGTSGTGLNTPGTVWGLSYDLGRVSQNFRSSIGSGVEYVRCQNGSGTTLGNGTDTEALIRISVSSGRCVLVRYDAVALIASGSTYHGWSGTIVAYNNAGTITITTITETDVSNITGGTEDLAWVDEGSGVLQLQGIADNDTALNWAAFCDYQLRAN